MLRNYSGAGVDERVDSIFNDNIERMRNAGAEIIDGLEIDTSGMGSAEYEVLLYEFKEDLNAYLRAAGTAVGSLQQVIEFNNENADDVMPVFGQEILLESQAKGPLTETAYLDALASSKQIARNGIDNAIAEHQLDAIVAPTRGPAWLTDHVNGDQSSGISSSSLAAVSGYPSITVPAGHIAGLPVGMSFFGAAYDDAKVIALAYAFEQASLVRVPPALLNHP